MKLLAQLGKIDVPQGVVGGDPESTVILLVKNGIRLFLIVSFIIFLLWTIIAGLRFIFSGGDSKSVGQAWSSIYWSLIGMVVVVGAFAIIKLVESFFGVDILSGGVTILPTN